MEINKKRLIDQTYQDALQKGFNKKQQKTYIMSAIKDYETRYGKEGEGLLGKMWKGLTHPVVKTGKNIFGAAYEVGRAGASKAGVEGIYTNPETGETIQNPFLSMSELTKLSADSGQTGIKALLDPGVRKQVAEQGVKPAAGMAAYGVPVGSVAGWGSTAALGAGAGALAAIGATPETATDKELLGSTAVGGLLGAGMAVGAKYAGQAARKGVDRLAAKIASGKGRDNRFSRYFLSKVIRPDIKRSVGWAADEERAIASLAKETKSVTPQGIDKELSRKMSTLSGQIDDALSDPSVASQRLKLTGLEDEILSGWKADLTIQPDRYSRLPDDVMANRGYAQFIQKAQGIGEPTAATGGRSIMGDTFITPKQLFTLKRDLGKTLASEGVWARKAAGEGLTRADLSQISIYNTLKRMIDASATAGGKKISSITMREHVLYNLGSGVARYGRQGVRGTGSAMGVLRNLVPLPQGVMGIGRAAQFASSAPARMASGALKGIARVTDVATKVAPIISGKLTPQMLQRLNILQRAKAQPLP